MNALDVLDQLEATSGQNDKIAILKANVGNQELVELLDAAMNFDRKFYVKKFEIKPNMQTACVGSTNEFLDILDLLQNRKITGNAAIEHVETFLETCTEQQQKWYSRVLRKDLRCNFGISLANKAGFNLHEFEVMLAKDGKECKKLEEIVSKGVYASPKFNGYRALAICSYGTVTLHSRNGLAYENFPSIVATLEKLCQNSSFILDGECMSDDFNKMQQTAMSSKSGKSVGDINYQVFGWVPFDEWQTKNFKKTTKERLADLEAWFDQHKVELAQANNVFRVDHKLLYTVADAMQFERECLAKGYEGAMLLPDIPYYVGKKSNKLLKLKTFVSWDCKVVGIYEGEGKNVGRMGGITVLQENGVECNLGTGWSDEDRDYIWQHQDEFIGRTIEVQYQELTPDKKMQFPSFVRWRDLGPNTGKI
jgi:DNA ligase-1